MDKNIRIAFKIYLRMLKNFLLYNKTSTLLFFAIIFGLAAVFLNELSYRMKGYIYSDEAIYITVSLLSLILTYLVVPLTYTDRVFLRRNLSNKTNNIFRAFQNIVFYIFTITIFILALLVIGVMDYQLISLSYLLSITTVFFVFLNLKSYTERTKPAYKVNFFKRNLKIFNDEIYPIFCLNLTYFLRRQKKNTVLGVLLIAFINLILITYTLNYRVSEPTVILAIPFVILLLFAMEKNINELKDIKIYLSSGLKSVFIADFLFWLIILFFQWIITVSVFQLLQIRSLEVFGYIAAFAPLFLLYGLILKFKYLQSRVLRSFGLGISIGLPLVVPVFTLLFLRKLKND